MKIRRAEKKDIDGLNRLLYQVAGVHHDGRPDLFRAGAKKYTTEELLTILDDQDKPILAAVEDDDTMLGYAFCQLKIYDGEGVHTAMRTLYVDDICVEESARGQHVGTEIFAAVRQLAKELGCYNVTLNVWECNPPAMAFYRSLGMTPYCTGMELIL